MDLVDFVLLQRDLPTTVCVGEKSYPVYTDFKQWIQLEVLLFEQGGSFLEKLPAILKLCYPVLPDTLEDAICGIASFYAGGQKADRKGKKHVKKPPLYSFLQDEGLIYAAFYQQYHIDLLVSKLHWWQFQALFTGLSEETLLVQIMHIRSLDISRFKSPEEKQFYRRLKEQYKLRDTRTEAEKEEDLAETLSYLF